MRIFKRAALIVSLIILASANGWAEDVTMTIVVSNPLDLAKKNMEIRQDLPIELKPEDVVDAGSLTVSYDEQRSLYFVQTLADLGPKESRQFKIVVHDVWKIPKEDMDFLLTQADARLKKMEGQEYYDEAKAHRDRIAKLLSEIEATQANQIGDVDARIETYRVNRQKLKDIRETITLSDNFKREAIRYFDFETGKKMINLLIESENPSLDSKIEGADIVRYLPEGIRPDYLVDTQGFDLKFDSEKNLFYLHRADNFAPGEKKQYHIAIADMWYIPASRLDYFTKTSAFLAHKLEKSSYEKVSSYISSEVAALVDGIKKSQDAIKNPEDKIALYTVNIKKVDEIEKKIEQLRIMVEEVIKPKATKISETLTALPPDISNTWKLIFSVIIFLAVISFFFFLLWWGQSKARMSQSIEDLGPKEATNDK